MQHPPDRSAPEVIVHGISNCDSVKRARGWLDDNRVAYRFHDFKKHGVHADDLANWMADVGWERLLNRQGTTWRKLDDGTRDAVQDAASAAELMKSQPSVIKRPVVRWHDGELTVGFDPSLFAHRAAA
ncbi:ArsC family reductase [Piscinibacter sakaiensis]|uniref:ArsC family reductase n=1 Tax=Piscinibacter sakaiensis TaxID=1547922 RepID=UPI003AAC672B